MKTAPSSQSPVASASTRRQGFARSARRLTQPVTAVAAPAQSTVSSCLTQLPRSSKPTDSVAKFLVNLVVLIQRLSSLSVHAFGAAPLQVCRQIRSKVPKGASFVGSQRFPESEVEVENLVSSFICVGSDTRPNATAELPAIRQVLPAYRRRSYDCFSIPGTRLAGRGLNGNEERKYRVF